MKKLKIYYGLLFLEMLYLFGVCLVCIVSVVQQQWDFMRCMITLLFLFAAKIACSCKHQAKESY